MAQESNEPQTERVANSARMIALLQRLVDERIILMVHLPDDNVRYNSALLAVNPNSQILTLDELTPTSGNSKALNAKKLHITGRMGGAFVRFRATIVRAETREDVVSYSLPFPSFVIYEQRRNAFRARIPDHITVHVSLEKPDAETILAELTDISTSGIGFALDPTVELNSDNDELYLCKVALPGGESLTCELEIRFAALDEKTKKRNVGGQFINMFGPQRKIIEKFVMYLQRETIRRKREIME